MIIVQNRNIFIFLYELFFYLTTSCSKLLNDNLNFRSVCAHDAWITDHFRHFFFSRQLHRPASLHTKFKSVLCVRISILCSSSLVSTEHTSPISNTLPSAHDSNSLKSLLCLFFSLSLPLLIWQEADCVKMLLYITINSIRTFEWIQLLLNIHRTIYSDG